jgi:hypothetical protein
MKQRQAHRADLSRGLATPMPIPGRASAPVLDPTGVGSHVGENIGMLASFNYPKSPSKGQIGQSTSPVQIRYLERWLASSAR